MPREANLPMASIHGTPLAAATARARHGARRGIARLGHTAATLWAIAVLFAAPAYLVYRLVTYEGPRIEEPRELELSPHATERLFETARRGR